MNILLVDSNKDDITLLTGVLVDHQVTTVSDYDEVLAMLKTGIYDIVIADLNMGDKLDISLLVLLKTMIPEIPVILYTNNFSMTLLKTAMKSKVNNYVLKSTEYTDIKNAIKNADYFEKFRNTYTLKEDISFQDISEIRVKAVKLGCLAADKCFGDIKDLPVIEFTPEDVYRILTGSYALVEGSKLNTNIKKGSSSPEKVTRNKILFVDDEDTLRSLLAVEIKDYFADRGVDIDIIHADTAEDAIEKYGKHKDSIITGIIDMKMPKTNADKANQLLAKSSGLEVLRQVKTYERRCECIILTAFAFSPELCECYRLGAFDLCEKRQQDVFFQSAYDAYNKAVINFEQFSDIAYTKLAYFRSAFASAFVDQLLRLFKGYRNLSNEDRMNIVEFEFLMDRVF